MLESLKNFIKRPKPKLPNDLKSNETKQINPTPEIILLDQTTKPTLTIIEMTSNSIKVIPSGGDGTGKYEIGKSTDASLSNIKWNTDIKKNEDASFTLNNLEADTKYWLRVEKVTDGVYLKSRIGTVEAQTPPLIKEKVIKEFQTEVILSAITGKISNTNLHELYELHRFVFNDQSINTAEAIDARWDLLREHIFKLYPQLDGATYDANLETSHEAWNKAYEIIHGNLLPICQIFETLDKHPEKQLLYYNSYKRSLRHWNGAPIVHFSFTDVKTGEKITLAECFNNKEVSEYLGGPCYKEIEAAIKDFDILWQIENEQIDPLVQTLEEVQTEYQRLLTEGTHSSKINEAMMELFKVQNKRL